MRNLLLPVAVIAAGLALWAGCESTQAPAQALPSLPAKGLQPGPDDPRIAWVTAQLLETYHYRQAPLDSELSAKFFDGYIDSLDPRHEIFLQTDLAKFAAFRTNLDKITLGGRAVADLTPAFMIFQRYLERFQQHAAYVDELLKQDKFKFNADERIQLDRRHEPFPTNLTGAQALWRQHLRYDYLQEKLADEISETNDTFTVRLPEGAATNIIATLARHNRWSLHMMTNLDSSRILSIYLNALAHAYDPHSDYLSAQHAQDFSINMNLSLFGIGAQLAEDDGYCTIHGLVPGGPAANSKQLNERDRILAVAQGGKPPVDAVDMELEKVVQQIRGPKGTEVRLTISPATDRAARKVVTLIRDEIKLEDAEAKARLVEMPDGHGGTNRIGIIDLPSFYAPVSVDPSSTPRPTPKYTSVDVAKLINRLKQEKVAGIIIDLRANPGGSLEEAIKFTGLFIKEGPVVLARDPDGHVAVDSDTDAQQLYDGPLAVMVNRGSASASEIAAAALQDYGRALIVGDISTHGKGTVQQLDPLKPFFLGSTNDPGELKITIRKFYRVSGASTQIKGVVPEIVLPDVLNYDTQIGETALDNPLPWDTIAPVSYPKLNLVQPVLADLRARSDARIATNQDFLYVQENIAQYQKLEADRTATLNESEAIKERERIARQNKKRDAERSARPVSGLKVYEITVKNADQPGLVEYQPGAEKDDQAATEFPRNVPAISYSPDANAPNFFATNTLRETSHADPLNVRLTNPVETNEAIGKNITTTNAAKSAASDKKSPPPFDPMLEETEHILEDYISDLDKSGILKANQ
jgi:carboxyl-terminal processing protease